MKKLPVALSILNKISNMTLANDFLEELQIIKK